MLHTCSLHLKIKDVTELPPNLESGSGVLGPNKVAISVFHFPHLWNGSLVTPSSHVSVKIELMHGKQSKNCRGQSVFSRCAGCCCVYGQKLPQASATWVISISRASNHIVLCFKCLFGMLQKTEGINLIKTEVLWHASCHFLKNMITSKNDIHDCFF